MYTKCCHDTKILWMFLTLLNFLDQLNVFWNCFIYDKIFFPQVCSELEEEKQKHAQDTAQGDDVTYMLEKERERLKAEVCKSILYSLSSARFSLINFFSKFILRI